MATRIRRFQNFSYIGRFRYSLTICTHDKQPIFKEAAVVEVIVAQILPAAEACDYAVIAYCVMPDHVHLVVEGLTESASLLRFMQRAKQLSGFHGKQFIRRPVWQTGYYERVLRQDEDLRTVVAYVLANPVRAGLVQNVADYPFIGSGVVTLAELLHFIQADST